MFVRAILVLIETYWNVNVELNKSPGISVIVLIETYWNVNQNSLSLLNPKRLRINRNILECKFYNRTIVCKSNTGINRNILECKYQVETHDNHCNYVLIETYWNVNSFKRYYFVTDYQY